MKIKILPQADFESEEEAKVEIPRLCSRCYALKVMVQSIISCLQSSHNMSGKIYSKRVARDFIATKNSYNQHISEDFEINHQLKKGEWKKYFILIRP